MKLNRSFKLFLVFSFFVNILFSKLIKPIQSSEAEFLEIYGNKREYEVIRKQPLIYEIEGPKLITVYIRRPVPKLVRDSVQIKLNISLDSLDPLVFNTTRQPSTSTYSQSHPAHNFTSSAKYMIQIPKGFHSLTLSSPLSNPLLVRVVTKNKPKRYKGVTIPSSLPHSKSVKLISNINAKEYYILQPGEIINFSSYDNEDVWIYTRLVFDKFTTDNFFYTMSIQNLTDSVYPILFWGEISNQTNILKMQKYPGKFNTLFFPFKDKEHELKLKNTSNKQILIRAERVK